MRPLVGFAPDADNRVPHLGGLRGQWPHADGSVALLSGGWLMTEVRKESDGLGLVEVPADRLWRTQTQRSLEHFSIGHDLILGK